MKFRNLIFVFFIAFLCFASTLNAKFSGKMTEKATTRDPSKQPFSSKSIWNMPIGSDAKFVPAKMEKAMAAGMTIDEDQPIKHVLKINVFGKKNLYYDETTKGFRWPAKRADGYANGNYGTERTKPVNKDCRMGALLALPPSIDLDKL